MPLQILGLFLLCVLVLQGCSTIRTYTQRAYRFLLPKLDPTPNSRLPVFADILLVKAFQTTSRTYVSGITGQKVLLGNMRKLMLQALAKGKQATVVKALPRIPAPNLLVVNTEVLHLAAYTVPVLPKPSLQMAVSKTPASPKGPVLQATPQPKSRSTNKIPHQSSTAKSTKKLPLQRIVEVSATITLQWGIAAGQPAGLLKENTFVVEAARRRWVSKNQPLPPLAVELQTLAKEWAEQAAALFNPVPLKKPVQFLDKTPGGRKQGLLSRVELRHAYSEASHKYYPKAETIWLSLLVSVKAQPQLDKTLYRVSQRTVNRLRYVNNKVSWAEQLEKLREEKPLPFAKFQKIVRQALAGKQPGDALIFHLSREVENQHHLEQSVAHYNLAQLYLLQRRVSLASHHLSYAYQHNPAEHYLKQWVELQNQRLLFDPNAIDSAVMQNSFRLLPPFHSRFFSQPAYQWMQAQRRAKLALERKQEQQKNQQIIEGLKREQSPISDSAPGSLAPLQLPAPLLDVPTNPNVPTPPTDAPPAPTPSPPALNPPTPAPLLDVPTDPNVPTPPTDAPPAPTPSPPALNPPTPAPLLDVPTNPNVPTPPTDAPPVPTPSPPALTPPTPGVEESAS